MADIAVIFSGQGKQSVEMFDNLETGKFRDLLSAECRACLDDISLLERRLFDNRIAQELICLYQLAQWEQLKNILPADAVLAGYSLGELSACACAGCLEPQTLFFLAVERAESMSRCGGAMIAVIGLNREPLAAICDRAGAYIAIVNGTEHFILGAEESRIDTLEELCVDAGASRTVRLALNVASHTPLMDAAARDFAAVLAQCKIKNPRNTVISSLDSSLLSDAQKVGDTLAMQLNHPVLWHDCLEAIHARGCRIFIEIGPGQALTSMALSQFYDIESRSLSEFRSIDGFRQWLEHRIQ